MVGSGLGCNESASPKINSGHIAILLLPPVAIVVAACQGLDSKDSELIDCLVFFFPPGHSHNIFIYLIYCAWVLSHFASLV